MNVLFVHAEEDYFSAEKPILGYEKMHFGVSYVSAVLRQHGHHTRLVMPTLESEDVIFEAIRDFDPGLVCFTSVYSVYHFLAGLAERVKRRHPDICLAVGGPHATLRPEECITSAYDVVCVGEGEYPTLELVEQLESGKPPGGIANLWIKQGDRVERNACRPFLEDLASLPFPDREMWLPWVANPISRPSFLAGRGCPFQCTYCCNHALRKVAEGKYVRLRSPANIAEEILEMKRVLYLMEDSYLEVETLGVDREWALELCSELEKINGQFEVPIRYGSNLRLAPNIDYPELFAALKRANFEFLNIGLESGSERVRREVLKRNYSNQDVVTAVRTAREYGLKIGFYNLIGIPGETPRDFRDTIRLNRACRPDWFLLSIFFPYPGTRLHDVCREQGLLDRDIDRELERRKPTLDLPGFSKRQIKLRFTWSPLLFNAGHKPMLDILKNVFRSIIFSHRKTLSMWWKATRKFGFKRP
jgi:anaerobic magnesium-protoporphyrin IX monomethyl ester cyclase